MANQNYAQVTEFIGQGSISWETDAIVAILLQGSSFNVSQKKVSELSGSRMATGQIPARWLGPEGAAMGNPVVFQKVAPGEYQVVVAQDDGANDPNLLAFVDTNASDDKITVARTGSLIVRPVEPDTAVPPERPPTIGVWMRLTA